MTLENMGWNDFFQKNYDRIKDPALKPARVTGVRKNGFLVFDGEEERPATAAGRLLHDSSAETIFPAAGDWVAVKGSLITHTLPRKNALSRGASGGRGKREPGPAREQVIAANVDTVFIVCGLDRDYNIRRIERYLTLVYNSGCTPAVILNKRDLHREVESFTNEVEAAAFGVPVYPVSAKDGEGLAALERWLPPGKTVVLVGSSGVGKSTLINGMAGEKIQAARPVSAALGKGVHTTTSRDLIRLPGGGMIIDNPGIREIAFWDDGGGIDAAFPEIDAWARECRFSDCGHDREPGCRVREAVMSGELPAHRLENYLKMKRELHYISQRREKSADRVEKERWKEVALKVKALKKKGGKASELK
ncbi:MAG: ribosome small subunit-dependent GTPase A [Desulfobacterales bacterium]|nr:ribosome small subunit-dependent GTPase A [Desulfobacterales bacterium]